MPLSEGYLIGRDCWQVTNGECEMAITKRGGHMAPVVFFSDEENPVQPYYISPWQTEEFEPEIPALYPLRGDSFCMPFGGPNRFDETELPFHGDTATGEWRFGSFKEDAWELELMLEIDTALCTFPVEKRIQLRKGESVVYISHILRGLLEPVPVAYHPTLRPPVVKNSVLNISFSPFTLGLTQVVPDGFGSRREYPSLRSESEFSRIDAVPSIYRDEDMCDCSVFPHREGFEDIVQLIDSPTPEGEQAWAAAVNQQEGYLWFSLKNSSILPSTLLWLSAKGRHVAPWSGRNCCIGVEAVCSCFGDGLSFSQGPNRVREYGIETTVLPGAKLIIPHIQGVVRIAPGFDRVEKVVFGKNGRVVFHAVSGDQAEAAVDYSFLDV